MKNLLKKILEYIFVGIFVSIFFAIILISLIYFDYSGNKVEHPTLIYLGSLFVLLSIIFGIVYFGIKKDNGNSKKRNNIKFNPDKIEWINIKIDTRNIKVLPSNHYREKPKSLDWQIQGIDQIFDSESSVIIEKSESSYLKCKHYFKGRNREFKSSLLCYDEITLKFLLAEKKEIDLFVNKRNMKDYYFDLGLIKK